MMTIELKEITNNQEKEAGKKIQEKEDDLKIKREAETILEQTELETQEVINVSREISQESDANLKEKQRAKDLADQGISLLNRFRRRAKNLIQALVLTVGLIAPLEKSAGQERATERPVSPTTEQSSYSKVEQQKENIKNQLVELIKELKDNKIIADEGEGFYTGKVGKYDIEYFDRNRNDQVEIENERVSIGYQDDFGSKHIISTSFGDLRGVVVNSQEALGLKKMTIKEFKNMSMMVKLGSPEDVVYAKKLDMTEIQSTVNNIMHESAEQQGQLK